MKRTDASITRSGPKLVRAGALPRPTRAALCTCALALGLGLAESPRTASAADPAPPVPVPATGTTGAPPSDSGSATGEIPLTGRLGTGQITIVGGNVAGARERALAEAMKQAVGAAIEALYGADVRTTHAKPIGQILARARNFVRGYRTIDEGERSGQYFVQIDAQVDEPAVRRTLDAAIGGTGASPAPAAGGSHGGYLLMGTGLPDAVGAVAAAFATTGAHTQPAPAALASDPNRAVELAGRQAMTGVAFVSGSARAEGLVRGPGIYSVSCSLAMRVLGAGSGTPLSDENTTARAFADREDRARTECLAHAAATLVGKAAPAQPPASADARTVVVDADVVEAAAVPALLRTFRRMGTVSAADVRRVVPGHAEIWVRTRAGADALLAGLGRDRDPMLQLDSGSVGGDTLRVRVRLRENSTVPPAGEGAPAATPPGAALPGPATGETTAYATALERRANGGKD